MQPLNGGLGEGEVHQGLLHKSDRQDQSPASWCVSVWVVASVEIDPDDPAEVFTATTEKSMDRLVWTSRHMLLSLSLSHPSPLILI